ncbi:phosphatidylinositol phosphatase PTPRQ [Aedes aegypti]|uniref:protein-tyrosine-phosphatase n=1 Tax=Aedes aegypti TaxID=7159 RepID=A0A1S4EX19_AEDAE|nr:phosphatidylinositol phosphatase PTPRQ [Aedes aegypti]XP_021710457.1 phosphatidylinositol phosphatase PTPRQ [Aedes aegypti]XP_021710458.1 phosphatidylinositol phosphatase PTPRQ [Aedes aegypti]XP_021710459.1 phosphatidylinositol phosphatase PTPRQ [Aedes aegypti]XP_021710460.1 phosphatidylinositol phosphatase PTPRQ [Aedes aegypti]XP_021710461.1 phosphatidylinositol phosphatase PTPRQ [Aedes aegypti]XP_021710462.1 phosphatidylinositol phosphatase PTPRQ [Aedes aegypti]XP_021710463.1 phosphatid
MVSVKEIRFFQLILLIVLVLFDVVAVDRPVTEVQNSLVTSAQCEPDSQLSTTPVNSIIESSTSDWTTIEDDLTATTTTDDQSTVTIQTENYLSNEIDDFYHTTCLILRTNVAEKNDRKGLPGSKSFTFTGQPNPGVSSQSSDILNVILTYHPAVLEEHICVTFLDGFEHHVENVIIRGANFYGIVKPDASHLETKVVNRCDLYTYNITAEYQNGKSQVKQLFTDELVGSYPVIVAKDGYIAIEWKSIDTRNCFTSFVVEERSMNGTLGKHSHVISGAKQNEVLFIRLNATDVCLLESVNVSAILNDGLQWVMPPPLWNSVQNLRVQYINSSAIQLAWDISDIYSHCVTQFRIFVANGSSLFWSTTLSNIVINDLESCKNYYFYVVPVDRYGRKHRTTNISVSLPEEPISRVQNVRLKGRELRWELPARGSNCLDRFIVIQKTENDEHSITNTTVVAKMSTLRKSQPVVFRFRKMTDEICPMSGPLQLSIIPVSASDQLGPSYEVTVPPPKPGPVQQLTTDTSVERQITLTWKKPALRPECVSMYRISYDDRNITSSETTVTISNLNSCVEYNFTVAPVDFAGEDCEGVTVNATVKEEKLSEVEDLELVEVDPRSLMVRWKPPANGTYCVASYRYVAWVTGDSEVPVQISNSTTDVHVTFVEVFACTKYNVQVIPVSKGNNDGNNMIAEILTKERVILRYHIDPVRMRNQMARSLELQSALTNDNNNLCELYSVRFTCSTYESEDEELTVITGEAPIEDPKSAFSAVVAPLMPYHEYNCSAAILNKAGWSDETSAVTFITGEDFPEHPRNLQLVGSFRMIELRWTAPQVKNGIITRYRVHIRSEGARYPNPTYCPEPDPYTSTFDLHEEDDNTRVGNWNNDELDHKISFLMPYTDYVVQVAAATKAGLGPYTEMVSVSTLPEKPDPVHEFLEYNVTLPEIDKPYNSTVSLTWKIPCNLNGRLRSFAGRFVGFRSGLEHNLDWSRTLEPGEDILENYSLTEARLEPEFVYNVSIMISVDDVADQSNATFLSFQSPAGIPVIDEEINWGTVNVMNAPNPTKSAMISLADIIFEFNVGSIQYVALLVSERQCQEDPKPQRNLSNEWPEVLSWKSAIEAPCTPQYQTTPKQWNPMEERRFRGRSDDDVLYVIGSETCEAGQEFCNGPLKPGTEYALIVRVFTNSGYSDSTLQIFRTDSLIQLTIIVISIFACLLMAFSLGLVILWRTHKLTIPPQTAVRSPNEEPADIPLKSFSGIYEELIQSNREKINKEYQAINFYSEQLINEKVTFFVAKENERKNRYLGIFPYDGNRVPLECDDIVTEEEDEEVNDYINASFIDGYKYQREYIATQGPKKETCFDFWRMILQYEVETIVMLTQTVENDRIKCYQYFPRFNQTLRFRDVAVKCTQELNLSFYQKRLFLVSRDNLTRPVFHYHFLAWPDHGCPASASDLIKFIKIIRSERKNLALPVVVHCSAGVGRTGTLIALDIILQRIQQEKKINIYETVKQLRSQRVKMVQTSEQYAFLYHACLEYTTRNNRKKPKTSDEESASSTRSNTNAPGSVAAKSARRNMINIKFPKYVHSGISNVKSYAPDDVEANT